MPTQNPASPAPTRFVLEGVPRIHFHEGGERCPEDMPFPSAMRAILDYHGEGYGCKYLQAHGASWRLDCTYSFFMAVTGNAFFLNWKPGWHGDNVALHNMSDDPEAPYRRAMAAAGYQYEWVQKQDGRDNEAVFRARIIESLYERGCPVLGFGVVGPPEPSIIAGYDEEGAVLLGWSYFQKFPEFNAGVEFEANGYFRKRAWFPNTECLLLFGERQTPPPLSQIDRETLRWAVQVARTPRTYGDRHNGHAAYAAWADHLLRDDDFATDDLAILRERHMAHDDAVCTVAEGRWYGSLYLGRLADREPGMAADLLAAAACYRAEHDLMWQVWGLVGGIGRSDAQIRKLADPEARRQMIPLILQARDKDMEAVAHIEQALER